MEELDWAISLVISGHAVGADKLGEAWAKKNSIPIDPHPALWSKYGNAAGPIRNREMAKQADALIAFWDGKSKGTENMILEAHRHKLIVQVFICA